jgi:hypothetical protein
MQTVSLAGWTIYFYRETFYDRFSCWATHCVTSKFPGLIKGVPSNQLVPNPEVSYQKLLCYLHRLAL